MFRLLSLAAVLALSAGISDFSDSTRSYEFIYHDSYDLLLTIHGDDCYYAFVKDDYSDENRYLVTYRHSTERYIEDLIHDGDDAVHDSTLEHVTDQFKDILADFHCTDKHIHTIELDFDDVEIIRGGYGGGFGSGGGGFGHGR